MFVWWILCVSLDYLIGFLFIWLVEFVLAEICLSFFFFFFFPQVLLRLKPIIRFQLNQSFYQSSTYCLYWIHPACNRDECFLPYRTLLFSLLPRRLFVLCFTCNISFNFFFFFYRCHITLNKPDGFVDNLEILFIWALFLCVVWVLSAAILHMSVVHCKTCDVHIFDIWSTSEVLGYIVEVSSWPSLWEYGND